MNFVNTRRKKILSIATVIAIGMGIVYWLTKPPKTNPILAGIPLNERVKGLKSHDNEVRKGTLRTLAAFGPKSAPARSEVSRLILDYAVRPEAIVCLGRMREETLPLLQKWLNAKKPENYAEQTRWALYRESAVEALGYSGPCAIPVLKGLLAAPQTLDEIPPTLVYDSLFKIGCEHPETLIDIVTSHPSLIDLLDTSKIVDCVATLQANPNRLEEWKKLLDSPHGTVRTFASRVLLAATEDQPYHLETTLCTQLMIDELVRTAVYEHMSGNDALEQLLELHRKGQPVLKKLIAKMLEYVNSGPLAFRSTEGSFDYLCTQLMAFGDALNPYLAEICEFVTAHFQQSIPPELEGNRDVCWGLHYLLILCDDRNQIREQATLVVGGGIYPTPINVLPTIVEVYQIGLSGYANTHLRKYGNRIFPLILENLKTAPIDQRIRILRTLKYSLNAGSPEGEFQFPELEQAVAPEIINGFLPYLDDPQTRSLAYEVLRGFGPQAAHLIPKLLGRLNLEELPHIVNAFGGIAAVVPEQSAEFSIIRQGFQNHPQRDEIWEQLHLFHPSSANDYLGAMFLRLLLNPINDQLPDGLRPLQIQVVQTGEKQVYQWNANATRWGKLASQIASLDKIYWKRLNQNRVPMSFADISPKAPLELRTQAAKEFWHQVENKNIRLAPTIAKLFPEGTPKEVAENVFGLLAKEKVNVLPLLQTLTKLKPIAGDWPFPDHLQKNPHLANRQLAAVQEVRWNPKSDKAKERLRKLVSDDPLVVDVLEPLADQVNDPIVLEVFLRAIPSERNPSNFAFIENCYRTICKGGAVATGKLIEKYLQEGNGLESEFCTMRYLMNRLIEDRVIPAKEIFEKAQQAKKPPSHLVYFMDDNTRDFVLDIALDQPLGPERFYVSPKFFLTPNGELRWPDQLPKLVATAKKDFGNPDDPKAPMGMRFAFDLLALIRHEVAWELYAHSVKTNPFPELPPHALRYDVKRCLKVFVSSRAIFEKQLKEAYQNHFPHPIENKPNFIAFELMGLLNPSDWVHLIEGEVDWYRPLALKQLIARVKKPTTTDSECEKLLEIIPILLRHDDPLLRKGGCVLLNQIHRRGCGENLNKVQHQRYRQRYPVPVLLLPKIYHSSWFRAIEETRFLRDTFDNWWFGFEIEQSTIALWYTNLELFDQPEYRYFWEHLPMLSGRRLEFLKLSVAEYLHMQKGDRPEIDPQYRVALLNECRTNTKLRNELFQAYFNGKLTPDVEQKPPALIRELAPLAKDLLVQKLRELKKEDSKYLPMRIMQLLGNLGSDASEAIPVLLEYVGGSNLQERIVARKTIEKIAPAIFAELE